ncbi:MAG: M18 family aminopeptidase, partial [Sandaracinaceae bacterium]
IHLARKVNDDGLTLNKQTQLAPIVALASGGALELAALLGVDGPIEAFDLCLVDALPPARIGARKELLASGRLDNLASCHAALSALLDGGSPTRSTRGIVLHDHEEVGSESALGADSPFLSDTLERLTGATDPSADARPRALAASFAISADMAHAVHPNYADLHEPAHRPTLGGGPVVKVNQNLRYATDGEMLARFSGWCAMADVRPQRFVNRADLSCGSTVGPITASRLGVRTVDVGNPMLSMHSCREVAACADVAPMIAVLRAYFTEDR